MGTDSAAATFAKFLALNILQHSERVVFKSRLLRLTRAIRGRCLYFWPTPTVLDVHQCFRCFECLKALRVSGNFDIILSKSESKTPPLLAYTLQLLCILSQKLLIVYTRVIKITKKAVRVSGLCCENRRIRNHPRQLRTARRWKSRNFKIVLKLGMGVCKIALKSLRLAIIPAALFKKLCIRVWVSWLKLYARTYKLCRNAYYSVRRMCNHNLAIEKDVFKRPLRLNLSVWRLWCQCIPPLKLCFRFLPLAKRSAMIFLS